MKEILYLARARWVETKIKGCLDFSFKTKKFMILREVIIYLFLYLLSERINSSPRASDLSPGLPQLLPQLSDPPSRLRHFRPEQVRVMTGSR